MTLRYSAAVSMRYGLSKEKAMASITAAPASFAGLDCGTLEVGKAADIVVLSGHPLDLTAAVQDVFIGGKNVFHRSSGAPAWAREEDQNQ